MYIGIDVGGTNIRVAGALSLEGVSFVEKKRFKTKKYFEDSLEDISEVIDGWTDEVLAVGFVTTGFSNEEQTELVYAINLPDWEGRPIVTSLSRRFGCPVILRNDAVASGLAEAYSGYGDGRDFLYVIWGTGVGGVSIRYVSEVPQTYEIQWDRDFQPLEEKFGGRNLEKRFGAKAEDLGEGEWKEVMGEFRKGLLALSIAYDQGRIVVGGGVAVHQRARIEEVAKQLEGVEVNVSGLGEDTGLYGAFAILKKHLSSQSQNS